jgi:hypothetical protein
LYHLYLSFGLCIICPFLLAFVSSEKKRTEDIKVKRKGPDDKKVKRKGPDYTKAKRKGQMI